MRCTYHNARHRTRLYFLAQLAAIPFRPDAAGRLPAVPQIGESTVGNIPSGVPNSENGAAGSAYTLSSVWILPLRAKTGVGSGPKLRSRKYWLPYMQWHKWLRRLRRNL